MIYKSKSKSSKAFLLLWPFASKNNFDAVGFIVLAKCVSGYPHFLHTLLPSLPQFYFILCGFCDKLKLSLHPTSVPPPLLLSLYMCLARYIFLYFMAFMTFQ